MAEEGERVGEKKKVMVAIDESECSHYALEWTLKNLGHSIANSELIIFTIQPISDYSYLYASSFGAARRFSLLVFCFLLIAAVVILSLAPATCLIFGHIAPDLLKTFQENQKKVALALLEKAKEICSKYGIVTETMTEIGDPKDAICEAVEKHHIQLLILGSHSRGALKRVFLGSVSNYCVHNAKCPVLVVRKPL